MTALWFDDLQVGSVFESEGRTVTEADVVNFCGVSGDFHQLHTDAEHARSTSFGARVAHGALVLSMATGLRSRLPFVTDALVAFAEIRSWRFIEPVFIGDTIGVITTVAELKVTSRPGLGVVVQDVVVRNQKGQMVQAGQMVNLLRSRPGVEGTDTL